MNVQRRPRGAPVQGGCPPAAPVPTPLCRVCSSSGEPVKQGLTSSHPSQSAQAREFHGTGESPELEGDQAVQSWPCTRSGTCSVPTTPGRGTFPWCPARPPLSQLPASLGDRMSALLQTSGLFPSDLFQKVFNPSPCFFFEKSFSYVQFQNSLLSTKQPCRCCPELMPLSFTWGMAKEQRQN